MRLESGRGLCREVSAREEWADAHARDLRDAADEAARWAHETPPTAGDVQAETPRRGVRRG